MFIENYIICKDIFGMVNYLRQRYRILKKFSKSDHYII